MLSRVHLECIPKIPGRIEGILPTVVVLFNGLYYCNNAKLVCGSVAQERSLLPQCIHIGVQIAGL